MTDLLFNSSNILTGSPEITDCKAFETSYDSREQLDVQLWKVPEGTKTHNGLKVAGAIGPIACDLCEHKCDDGYILIPEFMIGQLLRLPHVSARPEVVPLGGYAIASKTSSAIELFDQDQPDNEPSIQYEYAAPGFVSWDLRIAGEIADSAIEIHQAAVLTVDAAGNLTIHEDGFQDELDLSGGQVQEVAAQSEQEPKTEIGGQYRLF